MLTVLGIDPGTNNCGFSVATLKPNMQYQILTHGMFKHPVKGLVGSDWNVRCNEFASEVRQLKTKYSPDCVIAERFMTRGRGGGSTIEEISIMLGIIQQVKFRNACVITAAQWKNQANRVINLDSAYLYVAKFGVVAHRLDAVLIALYGASRWTNTPHFSMLTNEKTFYQRFLKHR